jgi:hypothetical protein
LSDALLLAIEGEMQDDPNRKAEKRPPSAVSTDGVWAIEISIRRAFLVHMDEQQRQFPTGAERRPVERSETRKR